MTETKALLRLLFRREDVVSAVEDGPIDIRSLTAAVDVSRPTVHRSLKSLLQHDVVVETASGYELTPYGKFVFAQYTDVIERFDNAHEHRELLVALESAEPISAALLDGAEYTPTKPFAPEGPLGEIETVVRESTAVRGFSPVVVGRYVSMFHEQTTTSALDAEVLTSPDVYDYLCSAWADQLGEAVDAGMTFFVADEPLPFGLILAEEPAEMVCVMIYDDGSLRGIIRNDSTDAVAWAHDVYESYRQTAAQPDVPR